MYFTCGPSPFRRHFTLKNFCATESEKEVFGLGTFPSYAQNKQSHQRSADLLFFLPVADFQWTHIMMNSITNLLYSSSCSVIWVVVGFCCRFCKMAHLVLLSGLPSHLSSLFVQHSYRLHGLPKPSFKQRCPMYFPVLASTLQSV